MNIKKILISHPLIRFAGSEARAAFALQEFQGDYEAVLVTGGMVDIEKLNRVYGTTIDPARIRQLYPRYHYLLKMMKAGDALRGMLFGRYLRDVARNYTLCLSTYNFMDFGKPALQCIADFCWDEEIRGQHDAAPNGFRGFFHRNHVARRGYLGCVRWIGGRRNGHIPPNPDDHVIANSRWSAGILKRKYHLEAPVLYPPVLGNFPEVPWKEKESGFVCIGRISPEKKVERMIEILAQVRRQGEDVHLHVIGDAENAYGEKIKTMARAAGDWVILEGKKYGPDKERLLACHRFGIHAREAEPFGIAVAEMVKAGCIVFAPTDGGQAEILDHPALLYDCEEDAISKIIRVIRDDQLQQSLCHHMAERGRQFSAECFRTQLRANVEDFIKRQSKANSQGAV